MEPHDRTEKCKEVFSLLSEYLNLELPTDACQEIETHLAGCPPCIEFAESLRKTVELCRVTSRPNCRDPWGRTRERSCSMLTKECSALGKALLHEERLTIHLNPSDATKRRRGNTSGGIINLCFSSFSAEQLLNLVVGAKPNYQIDSS